MSVGWLDVKGKKMEEGNVKKEKKMGAYVFSWCEDEVSRCEVRVRGYDGCTAGGAARAGNARVHGSSCSDGTRGYTCTVWAGGIVVVQRRGVSWIIRDIGIFFDRRVLAAIVFTKTSAVGCCWWAPSWVYKATIYFEASCGIGAAAVVVAC